MQQQKKPKPPNMKNIITSLENQPQLKPQQQNKNNILQMPSQKLTSIKKMNPFLDKSKQNQNSFVYLYKTGKIPCRINHCYNTAKIEWNQGIEISQLSYDPLMIICFEGLIQEEYPYCLISTKVIKDMLNQQNSLEKVIPILPQLIWPLRTALSSKNDKIFITSLEILKLLSNLIGSHLNNHLKNLLFPLSIRMQKKDQRDLVQDVLKQIQENGGIDTAKLIKGVIPTFMNA